MPKRRPRIPDAITGRALTACANPTCRGALIPGDAIGDLCGNCHRAEQRATNRATTTTASKDRA